MATVFQPPPTWAEPVIVDERTKKATFNPIWLKWFIDLVGIINASGGGGGGIAHNSTTGLQGGAANQYYHSTSAEYAVLQSIATNLFAGSTYTPTLFNTTNISASTAYQCQYLRVSGTVVVSGKVDVDPTAAGSVVLGISLPVASNIGAVEDVGGVAACPDVAGQSAGILGDAANDRATMQWITVDTANRSMYFTFAYQVI